MNVINVIYEYVNVSFVKLQKIVSKEISFKYYLWSKKQASFFSTGYDRAYHVLFEKHLENITSIEDGPNR